MAKYKQTGAENGQGLFMSINLKGRLLPGTFEYMLDGIIDTKIDTGIFDLKYNNDHTGASAVPPAALLKPVIYGYSRGRKSSRGIEELNKNNIIAKALTGDMNIHWTTIASFISGNGEEFKDVFVKVPAYCNEPELIGGGTFAVDGLRLPSDTSLRLTGTKEQFEKRPKPLRIYPRVYRTKVRGIAVSDNKNQVTVSAEAAGSANECEHFPIGSELFRRGEFEGLRGTGDRGGNTRQPV